MKKIYTKIIKILIVYLLNSILKRYYHLNRNSASKLAVLKNYLMTCRDFECHFFRA